MTPHYTQQYDLTWACYDNDTFDAEIIDGLSVVPSVPVGYGPTKELALIDLLEKLEEAEGQKGLSDEV
jgi:hypothetical protein